MKLDRILKDYTNKPPSICQMLTCTTNVDDDADQKWTVPNRYKQEILGNNCAEKLVFDVNLHHISSQDQNGNDLARVVITS
ncbi:hypothetical protein T265_02205 [Opisthorchis viverrini]|uniref:Uncharacterized protein n=1 Tax=Opisthorchis viverrini TaxID=6198 RepID=A0A074ZZW8_OPIVI|nr:hypothetical protein T265_02205 [Opisthorchis viverrini]KER31562.1 hypothetical protein T265_02205 [Opisthorchis viverrini]